MSPVRRIFTRPTLRQRFRESKAAQVVGLLLAICAFLAAQELLCTLLGVPAIQ